MAKSIRVSSILFLSCATLLSITRAASFNVLSFGAKPDGRTDSTQPFLKAWASACRSIQPATVYVPRGRYLIKAAVFKGPCRNRITVKIDGTLVAPDNYWALGNSGYWLLFVQVNRLSVIGGTLDAKGAGFWCISPVRKTASCSKPSGYDGGEYGAGAIKCLQCFSDKALVPGDVRWLDIISVQLRWRCRGHLHGRLGIRPGLRDNPETRTSSDEGRGEFTSGMRDGRGEPPQ
ncbi:polygalacturonase-like [Coffea eugenioides]|uniref:polygalacturonase-like n=1 Tax=Coffea eugenioides TaxID=49369 RepID=UPI000F60AE27|nr:polygalacturonase-like [Coffea eugenioides]